VLILKNKPLKTNKKDDGKWWLSENGNFYNDIITLIEKRTMDGCSYFDFIFFAP
jgi:hypothetical protein